MDEKSLTIAEFCEAESVSRAMLYKLWKEGSGPRYFELGSRRRISPEARREWRREREAETAAKITAAAEQAA